MEFAKPHFLQLRDRLRRAGTLTQRRYLPRSDSDVIVMDVARFPYMGFGATISWVHMAFVACDALGARLAVKNPDQWPFGGRRIECALDNFIKLPAGRDVTGNERSLQFNPGDKQNLRDWGYFDEPHWRTSLFGYKPPAFSTLEDYRRAALARAYVPTSSASSVIAEKLSFLPQRYVAWHIRRGDKTAGPAKEDDAVSVARYAQVTHSLISKDPSPPTHIVVCTDSDQALEEAVKIAPKIGSGTQIVFDQTEKRWDGYCALHRAGGIDDANEMVAEVLTAQKIIEIFRGAEYLVGCNSSYLFRVGSMLRATDHTMVSLSENKTFRKYFPI